MSEGKFQLITLPKALTQKNFPKNCWCYKMFQQKINNSSDDLEYAPAACEPRRIEDKCDMKGLTTTMVTITMQPPPASKRVPMVFYGWLCFEEHTSNDNIFMDCSLMADRSYSLEIVILRCSKQTKEVLTVTLLIVFS